MADTEKITINLGVVDLGKIDLLVEEGFYQNRADFIRSAIRNLLDTHQEIVKQVTTRRALVIGVLVHNQRSLEKVRARGEMLDLQVVGTLVLNDDIPAELARAAIQRIRVFGAFKANDTLKAALADRTNPETH